MQSQGVPLHEYFLKASKPKSMQPAQHKKHGRSLARSQPKSPPPPPPALAGSSAIRPAAAPPQNLPDQSLFHFRSTFNETVQPDGVLKAHAVMRGGGGHRNGGGRSRGDASVMGQSLPHDATPAPSTGIFEPVFGGSVLKPGSSSSGVRFGTVSTHAGMRAAASPQAPSTGIFGTLGSVPIPTNKSNLPFCGGGATYGYGYSPRSDLPSAAQQPHPSSHVTKRGTSNLHCNVLSFKAFIFYRVK